MHIVDPGLAVFFTGLSGAGKSTLATALADNISVNRYVTMLDGDVVRNIISSKLGFSKEDRDLNIRRIGYVASEIVKHNGFVICAAIAPYREVRQEIRELFPKNRFILVHVATPLNVCESRDIKGLYKKARAGKIKEFTGISDPYEIPLDAELTIDTTDKSIKYCVKELMEYINARIIHIINKNMSS